MMSEKKKDIMLTQDGCGYCKEAEELFKEQIESGKMEVIPVESPYGRHLADKYDIDATPAVIRKYKDEMKKCYINFEKKVIECEDGTENAID